MTVETLQTISMTSFIVAGILFLVAVALFFLLDVPKLFGDITGRTAKKAIENIRQQNEQSGDKAYKPSPVNLSRGRVTDKISASGRLERKPQTMGGAPGTEKLGGRSQMAMQSADNETTVLNMEPSVGNETTVLNQQMTGNETTVLNQFADPFNGTTVLDQTVMPNQFYEDTMAVEAMYQEEPDSTVFYQPVFVLEVEMGFLGSSEIIE